MGSNVGGVLSGELADRELRGCDNRLHGRIVARRLRPSNGHITGLLVDFEPDVRVRLQSEPGGLQDSRNGGTDDVLAVLCRFGMTFGKERGQPVEAVPAKGYVEHGVLGKVDLRDLDLRETLAVADQFPDALLGLILENQDLLGFALVKHGAGNNGPADGRQADLYGVLAVAAAAGENNVFELYVRTNFALQKVARNNVAFADLVLLSARFDDRVHNLENISRPSAPLSTRFQTP